MTKRETTQQKKSSKKSVFVDTNRFRNGCFCANMCKPCTCCKADLITTPVGALKIIELVRYLVFYVFPFLYRGVVSVGSVGSAEPTDF